MLIYDDQSDEFDSAVIVEADPSCRLCHSQHMVLAFDLGTHADQAYFPSTLDEIVPEAPLRLMYCPDCSLVQLDQACDYERLYRNGNYGYRSGQNPQMREHLRQKADQLTNFAHLNPGDTVLDIGSNDGTFLGYFSEDYTLVGCDPTAQQFNEFYASRIERIWEFFSAERFLKQHQPAKLITSISMFYDLEDPVGFASQVAECLTEDGSWHLEQCDLPTMLRMNGYDAICSEHLMYYSLKTIRQVLERVGMYVDRVEYNSVNGGSAAITAKKHPRRGASTSTDGAWFEGRGLNAITADNQETVTLADLYDFRTRALRNRQILVALITKLNNEGKTVGALGASTKGNTVLQFSGLGPDQVRAIGEVNPQKFGHFTPGTGIPIVPDSEVRNLDVLLVLPWHFASSIIEREQEFLAKGGKLIFPLPEVRVVDQASLAEIQVL